MRMSVSWPRLIACVVVVGVGLWVTVLEQHGGVAVGAAGTNQDPAALKAAFGIRFSAVSGVQNGVPQLPSGGRGISESEAINTAVENAPAGVNHVSGAVLPEVTVTTQYTLFSDDRFGDRSPSGALNPFLQDRPAWLVTFSGPGVQDLPSGPARPGAVHHEVTVVIDAATGQYLLGYSYR